MICPECNGRGESIYYIETHRDENSVTVEQRKGICRTCNGSGEKKQSNADRIRAMSDEELAKWLCSISTAECCDRSCPARDICDLGDNGLIKWLKQPVEGKE